MIQPDWPRRAGATIWRQARRAPVLIKVPPFRISPSRPLSPLVVAYGFGAMILVGTILLLLPVSQREGAETPAFIDALFTAASAVTVTGLVTMDTAHQWSTFGQGVILVLIQLGGLGFMTGSTLILLALRRRVGLRERLLLKESLKEPTIGGLVRLVRRVALWTLVIELLGAAALFSFYRFDYSLETAGWQAAFHAVSAFNNAGFSTLPDSESLSKYTATAGVLLVFAALIMLGGVGITVLLDLVKTRKFSRFSLDTKMVLTIVLTLWAFGTLMIFITEYSNDKTLGPLSVPDKLLNSFFLSVTARTAGFNTVGTGSLNEHTLFFLTMLMFIGAASGSTGGGIKVNTFGVILFTVFNTVRGKDRVEGFSREIPKEAVYKALTLVFVAVNLIALIVLLLIVLEGGRFMALLFEGVSAFGTVGLSTGITPTLSLTGKALIIATMFIGRIGPLTLVFALAQRGERGRYQYAEESVKIG